MTNVLNPPCRCRDNTASGSRCKCWATCFVNHIPFCDQHGAKRIREAALAIERKSGAVGKKSTKEDHG